MAKARIAQLAHEIAGRIERSLKLYAEHADESESALLFIPDLQGKR